MKDKGFKHVEPVLTISLTTSLHRPPCCCHWRHFKEYDFKYSVSSAKLHPSQLHSQSQASRPLSAAPDGRQPSANEVSCTNLFLFLCSKPKHGNGNNNNDELDRVAGWTSSALEGGAEVSRSKVRRSPDRVPPTVQLEETCHFCFTHTDGRTGTILTNTHQYSLILTNTHQYSLILLNTH